MSSGAQVGPWALLMEERVFFGLLPCGVAQSAPHLPSEGLPSTADDQTNKNNSAVANLQTATPLQWLYFRTEASVFIAQSICLLSPLSQTARIVCRVSCHEEIANLLISVLVFHPRI